jgi:hypothetical protein
VQGGGASRAGGPAADASATARARVLAAGTPPRAAAGLLRVVRSSRRRPVIDPSGVCRVQSAVATRELVRYGDDRWRFWLGVGLALAVISVAWLFRDGLPERTHMLFREPGPPPRVGFPGIKPALYVRDDKWAICAASSWATPVSAIRLDAASAASSIAA